LWDDIGLPEDLVAMARLEGLRGVGVFSRNQRRAKEFFTSKVGLRVREEHGEFGYLALGATKGGPDASLTVWQPDPKWGDAYESAAAQIGQVTGVGFRTDNLEGTVRSLKGKRVKVETFDEGEGMGARFRDPDGNTYFLFENPRAKVRRSGLAALDFVTVVSRDAATTGEFFTKALGMRARRTPGEDYREYRLQPVGTALVPFTPRKDMYDDPGAYEGDMAHLGEETYIVFETSDLPALQDKLLKKGVRFKRKAQMAAWGGMEAEIYDPDDNSYMIVQPRRVRAARR
jgi:catechol 2,3-dioxygenase-like lactoylglutathione lyase family enzyme